MEFSDGRPRGLVGRDGDLRRVAELVPARRLVTLTGPGGVGKTALALAAAGRLRADGVAVAELAGLPAGPDGAELVDAAIGRAVGDAGMPGLLVLDNAEHLAEAARQVCVDVLSANPGTRILVTARRPLGHPGETLLEIGPLPEEPAVELFRRRAAERGPALPEGSLDVPAICRDLGGLPLALELAAARLGSMSLTTVRGWIAEHRTEPVVRRGRPHPVPGGIEWSLDLLTSEQRTLATRLAVFAAPWRPAEAAEVCGHPPLDATHIPDLLADLAEDALAGPHDAGLRLPPAVRDACLSAADPADLVQTRDRHLAYQSKRDAHPAEVATALAWAVREDAPPQVVEDGALLAARAGSLRWVGRFLAREDTLSKASRAELHLRAGRLLASSSRPDEARARLVRALDLMEFGHPEREPARELLRSLG